MRHQNIKTSLYAISKNVWVLPFFLIFMSVREKLQFTVSFDHPVISKGQGINGYFGTNNISTSAQLSPGLPPLSPTSLYQICFSPQLLTLVGVCSPVRCAMVHELYHHPPRWYAAQLFQDLSLSLSLGRSEDYCLVSSFVRVSCIFTPVECGDQLG